MPSLGEVPEKAGSVAQLRLATMAQIAVERVLEAFKDLNEKDHAILSEELARTGCQGQVYVRDTVQACKGPAFLVYYGPALLNKNAKMDSRGVLEVLAEVFRRARDLWPLQEAAQDQFVTLRVDAIKDLDLQNIKTVLAGSCWTLEKTSSVDAVVSKMSLIGLQTFPNTRKVLDFGDISSSIGTHSRASSVPQQLPKTTAAVDVRKARPSLNAGPLSPRKMPNGESWCSVFAPCVCGSSGTPVTEMESKVEATI